MPWLPELFTAPALQRVLDERRRDSLVAVPYFDGLMAGDPDALVESFAGEPEVHDPVRGRVKGKAAFRAFVLESSAWLGQHHASVDDVEHVILDRHGFEEVVLHVDSDDGAVDVPIAVVADRQHDGRIDEVRIYFSSRPLTGRHTNRPPLLQPDPGVLASDVVEEYLRAFAAGDVGAILAAFEPDGCAGRPGDDEGIHRGPDGLSAFYGRLFAGGGIPLETCALVDDGRACALEYNVVQWGTTRLPPQAGVAVFVRGQTGRLASVRVYDDAEPPLGPPESIT
jgi:SnoaL-like domain